LGYAAFNFFYAYLAPLGSWHESFLQKIIKDLFVSFIYGVWIFEVLANKRSKFLYSAAALPIVLYLCLAFIGMLRSVSSDVFLGVAGFRNMVMYIPVFFAVAYYMKDKRDIEKVVSVLIFTGSIVALLGIYEFFFSPLPAHAVRHELFIGRYFRRIYSTLLYPGNLAFLMVVLSVILLSFHNLKRYFVNRWISYSLLILFTATLFLTYARAGVLALLLGAGYLFWVNKRRKALLGAVMLLVVIITSLYIFLPSSIWRYVRLFENITREQSVVHRVAAWHIPFELLKDHPLLFISGIGIDKVGNVSAAMKYGAKPDSIDIIQADNYYLQILIATGIIGPILLLWILGALFREAVRIDPLTRDVYLNAIIKAIRAVILIFALLGLFSNIWELFPRNFYFWFLMGLIPVIGQISASEDRTDLKVEGA
jgi:O-antigen ligase